MFLPPISPIYLAKIRKEASALTSAKTPSPRSKGSAPSATPFTNKALIGNQAAAPFPDKASSPPVSTVEDKNLYAHEVDLLIALKKAVDNLLQFYLSQLRPERIIGKTGPERLVLLKKITEIKRNIKRCYAVATIMKGIRSCLAPGKNL